MPPAVRRPDVAARQGKLAWAALAWNALFLAVLYWVGDLGMRHGDRVMVNRAFSGFSLWLLARYFDTFWSLCDRALFFMTGGVLLLAGDGGLERRRRLLLSGLEAREIALPTSR